LLIQELVPATQPIRSEILYYSPQEYSFLYII